jgi:hypothetical protein
MKARKYLQRNCKPKSSMFFITVKASDNERLGREQLPAWLKELGFRVLRPRTLTEAHSLDPYIGGPYFFVTFEDGEHKGVIFNRVDSAGAP